MAREGGALASLSFQAGAIHAFSVGGNVRWWVGSRLKCKISAEFAVKFAGKWHQAEDYLGEIVINDLYPIKDI